MTISLRTLAVATLASALLSACTGGGTSVLPSTTASVPTMTQSVPPDPGFDNVSGQSSSISSGTLTGSTSMMGAPANGASPAASPAAQTAPSGMPSASPAASSSPAPAKSPNVLDGNWAGYPLNAAWRDGSTHGAWAAKHDGNGKTRVVSDATISNALQLNPKKSSDENQTHTALVTSSENFDDFDATIDLQTIKQLRSGTAPRPWEAGWFLWHYSDDSHFYYFAPKTNGWELGKEDPSAPTGRHYLAVGTSPAFPVGTLQKIRVVQNGGSITVYDNGLKIVSVTDTKSPYDSGSFGLYSEDSQVNFGSLTLTTSAGTSTI